MSDVYFVFLNAPPSIRQAGNLLSPLPLLLLNLSNGDLGNAFDFFFFLFSHSSQAQFGIPVFGQQLKQQRWCFESSKLHLEIEGEFLLALISIEKLWGRGN